MHRRLAAVPARYRHQGPHNKVLSDRGGIGRQPKRAVFPHAAPMGDESKVVGFPRPTALLSELPSLRKKSICSVAEPILSHADPARSAVACRMPLLRVVVEINADVLPLLPNHVCAIGQRIGCKCPTAENESDPEHDPQHDSRQHRFH